MRPDLITDLFQKEAMYWWNVSKREMIFSLLGSMGFLGSRSSSGIAVDIGCGGGYTAKVFESYWRVVGVDVSRDALHLCQRRGLSLLCRVDLASCALPFKTSSFEVVLALDVIEHIKDDVYALSEFRRILKPGGLLIVTVPAFMALWSPWDEALGHLRRYRASSLAEACQGAGLVLEKLTYMMFFLFPIAVLVRWLKRVIQRDARNYSSDFIPLPGIVNRFLVQIGRLEQWIITRLNLKLPFGLSVIAVMTKRRASLG